MPAAARKPAGAMARQLERGDTTRPPTEAAYPVSSSSLG